NHLAELIAPCFVFWPRLARQIAGSVIIIFQVVLIISGNLSFLNWLTIVPTLACFDDRFWTRLLPRFLVRKAETAAAAAVISKPMITSSRVLAVVIGILSIQPVSNMLSSRQIMNTSFDPLDLVNTYGAFGTVEKERMNLVFEGTMDDEPNEQADWKPYIYKGLPVLPDNPSPQVAPYQLRLDWQLWFAAMSTSDEYPWTLNLVSKLLHNDPGALSLLAQNPFPDQPPKFIRVVRYHYSFAKPGNSKDLWWNRKRVDIWLEPLSTRDALIQPYNKHP
ncbi:MAG TPA: lipase maturation factor family protein, partial [Flavitalea sp.]|nr:lipase maturation factor family protein [Flavitalea sp.]